MTIYESLALLLNVKTILVGFCRMTVGEYFSFFVNE